MITQGNVYCADQTENNALLIREIIRGSYVWLYDNNDLTRFSLLATILHIRSDPGEDTFIGPPLTLRICGHESHQIQTKEFFHAFTDTSNYEIATEYVNADWPYSVTMF